MVPPGVAVGLCARGTGLALAIAHASLFVGGQLKAWLGKNGIFPATDLLQHSTFSSWTWTVADGSSSSSSSPSSPSSSSSSSSSSPFPQNVHQPPPPIYLHVLASLAPPPNPHIHQAIIPAMFDAVPNVVLCALYDCMPPSFCATPPPRSSQVLPLSDPSVAFLTT